MTETQIDILRKLAKHHRELANGAQRLSLVTHDGENVYRSKIAEHSGIADALDAAVSALAMAGVTQCP